MIPGRVWQLCGVSFPDSGVTFDAIESSSGGSDIFTDRRVGWRFTVGVDDLTVNYLSVKAGHSGNEKVQIHRWSDGALIAEATISVTTDALVLETITPIVLSSGVDYIVSMATSGFDQRDVIANETNTFYSGITYVESRTNTIDDMPTLATGNSYTACGFGYQ